MAGYVLFISEEKLKQSTAIQGNVDVEYLLPYIQVAQDKYLSPKLGGKLYDFIADLIAAGTIGDAGNEPYKLLVDDYIGEMLVHYAFFECIPFLRYKIQNGNIYSKTSETGQALSRPEAQDLREEVRNTAEFYTDRLIDFLCCKSSDYPLYGQSQSCGQPSVDRNAFYNGINLEKPSNC
jgi:hypothetical protein|tara:strand:- start:2256 stop:2792 length:537 start_codon:yes stop_codon:yes gene_type:complete